MKIRFIGILLMFVTLLNASTTINIEKDIYSSTEKISVNLTGMSGNANDWIAIYPLDSSTDWGNVLQWKWASANGTFVFDKLPLGNYEVRVFLNNSFTIQASDTFSVEKDSVIDQTTVITSESTYFSNENIVVNFTQMSGNSKDWIAIYPKDSSTNWNNVISWKYTQGDVNGRFSFNKLPVGSYTVRAFFNNSFNVEASYNFEIEKEENVVLKATVTTEKDKYFTNEQITVTFENMSGNQEDWIAIYPAGSTTDWNNVILWKYTKGSVNGNLSFDNLPVGNYSVRAFFNNSFDLKSSYAFVVKEQNIDNSISLTLNKDNYAQNELVYVTFDKMEGNNADWIGIYPSGASNAFNNVIDWKYTNGKTFGKIALGGFPENTLLHGSTPMPGLAEGNYEIRAFFNNTLNVEKVLAFRVIHKKVKSTVYENANGAISPDWVHVSGPFVPEYTNGVLRLQADWINEFTNTSEYILPFAVANRTQKVLELDVGGAGRWTPHFNVGVLVDTKNGQRRMLWDSFLNHYEVDANEQNHVLSFPTYVELQRDTADNKKHFRVNIEKYLKVLEPDNEIIRIRAFFATGGDLDNIKLSSH